tara:strand:- start:199 stop:612 length:414 start_codon:yes stop_codon:yes gene_type:complete
MEVTIRQSESKEINGTHRIGVVPIRYSVLKKTFGVPHYRHSCDKVKAEWNFTISWIDNGMEVADSVVTIYDYYNSDRLRGEFHIGGHNGMALEVAFALLDDDNVTPDNILTDKVKAKLMEIGEVNFPHIWEDCNVAD